MRPIPNAKNLRHQSRKYAQMPSIANIGSNDIHKINHLHGLNIKDSKRQESINNTKHGIDHLKAHPLQHKPPNKATKTSRYSRQGPNSYQESLVPNRVFYVGFVVV